MKVLFFSDIHSDMNALKKIVKKSDSAELVVCLGDLTNNGESLLEYINELSKVNKNVLIIPGNNETPTMIEESIDEYENIFSIHDNIYQDKNIRFLGIGGSNITPFNTVFELSEGEIKKILEKYNKVDCFVTHCPPKNTSFDLIPSKMHVGSSEVLNFILKNNPKFCACGHIHENEGKKETVGKTICFNPGKEGLIIEI